MDPYDIYGEGLAAAREWQAYQRSEHDEVEERPGEGNSLLHELAEESGGRLVEIAPGCWYESKIPHGGLT